MKPTNHFLFCPGPVNIASNIKKAVVKHEIGHREPEFSLLIRKVNDKLLDVFEVRSKKLYQSVLVTGSGTSINEAVLSSVVDNKRILIVTNGEFGERLLKMSKLHNKYTFHLDFGWAEEFNHSSIEDYIKKNKIDIVMVAHHETSTGMLNDIQRIGEISKKYNLQFIVDAVSSAGVEKIDLEKWNISLCTTSSGKAFASLPGLGIVIGRVRDFELLANNRPKSIYLDLYNLYKFARYNEQTPNTPAVQLIFALNRALANILHVGVKNKRDQIRSVTLLLRNHMKKMGFQFLINEKNMCSMLTTVILPESIKIEELRTYLRKKKIIIYNGKGPFLNRVFQVGNIGNLNKANVKYFIGSLAQAKYLLIKDVEMTTPSIKTAPISYL